MNSQDTITLYRNINTGEYNRQAPMSYSKAGEFRTVSWCTIHGSSQNEEPYCDYDRFLSLIHDSPGPECVFVDKLVEV